MIPLWTCTRVQPYVLVRQPLCYVAGVVKGIGDTGDNKQVNECVVEAKRSDVKYEPDSTE